MPKPVANAHAMSVAEPLSPKGKRFILVVIFLGAISFFTAIYPFRSENPGRYLAFLATAVLASGIRLSLHTITGTLSINFLFVLIGIIALSPSETMVLACLVTLIQCVWKPPRKPQPIQVAFNVANIALTVLATTSVYHSWSFPDLSIDLPLRLLLATAVYFVVNSFPVAVAIGLSENRNIVGAWRECYIWTLPYYMIGAFAAGAFSFLKSTIGWPTLLLLVPFIHLIYRHYRLYMARLELVKKHAAEMADLHMRIIEAFAIAIEAKDHNTHDHLHRVQTICLALGEELRLGQPEMDALRAAALLHDVGKLAVPEHIISKPGRLTREEFDKLKIHPLVGAEILERIRFPYPVVPIVRHHHEKWDGTGYPDGLSGEEIPIGARILAVADCFDALSSDRQYRRALSHQEALKQIVAESGISFDPVVVETLEKRFESILKQIQATRPEWTGMPTDFELCNGESPASGLVPEERAVHRPASFLASIAAARQEAQALFELAQELGNSLSLDETLSVLAIRLRRTVPFDSIVVFVRRDEVLRPEFVSGENVRLLSKLEIPIGEGLCGWVARNRKPILNGDPLLEPGYKETHGRVTPLRSALAIPLEGINGVVGVMALYRLEPEAFSRDHLRILQAISGKVAMSIENALRYRQAENSASTDFLTGLLNARSLFLQLDSELARCRRLETPLAVLVCDLDGFKLVNDRFGHLEGNRLLQQVAQRLRQGCREYDCIARMGGDEFVLVLPGLGPDAVRALVPRLQESVRGAGLEVLGEDIIGFSVGEAYFPADGSDAEQLLAEADRRMYQFKAAQKVLNNRQRGFDFDYRPAAL